MENKGVENEFTNSLLYQDSLKLAMDPSSEDADSENEADTEPERKEKCF